MAVPVLAMVSGVCVQFSGDATYTITICGGCQSNFEIELTNRKGATVPALGLWPCLWVSRVNFPGLGLRPRPRPSGSPSGSGSGRPGLRVSPSRPGRPSPGGSSFHITGRPARGFGIFAAMPARTPARHFISHHPQKSSQITPTPLLQHSSQRLYFLGFSAIICFQRTPDTSMISTRYFPETQSERFLKTP